MQQTTILWADDEIDLLKPHILFLKEKGYDVTPVNSGADAIEEIQEKSYDLVFLDENMPGLTGLQTLTEIKSIRPTVPVVMITKSEEEHIMEEAIGAKIADYLIKPVNPSQILLSVKKVLDNKRLVSEKTNSGYQRDFRQLGMQLSDRLTPAEWAEVYKKLVYWELEINETEGKSMAEVFNMQKDEANTYFGRFITESYEDWVNGDDKDAPLMSHQLFKERVFPTHEGHRRHACVLRADRQPALRPVEGARAHHHRNVHGGQRGDVLRHPAHHHGLRPQRHFLGHDARPRFRRNTPTCG